VTDGRYWSSIRQELYYTETRVGPSSYVLHPGSPSAPTLDPAVVNLVKRVSGNSKTHCLNIKVQFEMCDQSGIQRARLTNPCHGRGSGALLTGLMVLLFLRPP